MMLPLVLWSNIAQQEPPINLPQVSDKFVLVREPGPTPARLKQAAQTDRKLRIDELFPLQEYDRIYVEGTNFTVIIDRKAVPLGALNDALKLVSAIAKSPDLTARGKEIPDSIAEVIFARSFIDFSKAAPEVKNRLAVGARLQYLVELISPQKKFSFGHLPEIQKVHADRILQMTWPPLPQSLLRGEEPSDEEIPRRPKALTKEVNIDFSYVGRPVDGTVMKMVNDAIQTRVQETNKEIAEKTLEIEAKLAVLGNGVGVLKSGGTRSELPQKVLDEGRSFASMPVKGQPVDENAVNIFFTSFDRFSTTRKPMFLVPLRSFPGNGSTLMELDLLP